MVLEAGNLLCSVSGTECSGIHMTAGDEALGEKSDTVRVRVISYSGPGKIPR